MIEKKYFIKKVIGIGLIVIGVGIIGTAIGMKYWGQMKQKDMINEFENSIKNYKQDTEISKTRDDKSIEINNEVIGILKIPKIDLKVAIGEGVDMENLKYAVGHFPQTAMAGEVGNFCVAGHRSYTYSEYFNRLDEITEGDEIYVQTKKGEFRYKVYEKKVVEPSEYSVLNPTNDVTLTLITCTPIRSATHRLIIKGKIS